MMGMSAFYLGKDDRFIGLAIVLMFCFALVSFSASSPFSKWQGLPDF